MFYILTGFATTKGNLVRSLLYEKAVEKLRMYGDALKFGLLLGIVAAIGSVYSVLILSLMYHV